MLSHAKTHKMRTLRRVIVGIWAGCAMQLASACAQEDGSAAAHRAFALSVAESYGVAAGQIVVQPRHAGLPDNPYDRLAIGPFLALVAEHPALDHSPRGFAAPDGRVVHARQETNLADLLDLAGLGSGATNGEAIVRRLMWIYDADLGSALITDHPEMPTVAPPAITALPGGGAQIVWHVTTPGNTGFVGVYLCTVQLGAGGVFFSKIFVP